jgi:hypothetical protein
MLSILQTLVTLFSLFSGINSLPALHANTTMLDGECKSMMIMEDSAVQGDADYCRDYLRMEGRGNCQINAGVGECSKFCFWGTAFISGVNFGNKEINVPCRRI